MISRCARPLRAHSKNGCAKCVLQTQSLSRRAPLIPTGIFNKIFFNDCEASATINEFCSQSEPCGRARSHEQFGSQSACRLVVASYLLVVRRWPRDPTRI